MKYTLTDGRVKGSDSKHSYLHLWPTEYPTASIPPSFEINEPFTLEQYIKELKLYTEQLFKYSEASKLQARIDEYELNAVIVTVPNFLVTKADGEVVIYAAATRSLLSMDLFQHMLEDKRVALYSLYILQPAGKVVARFAVLEEDDRIGECLPLLSLKLNEEADE